MPRESTILSGISNVDRQRQAAGSFRNNAPFSITLPSSDAIQYTTITGIVACNPIIFDVEGSQFVKSDNVELNINSKSNSYKVVYYYSSEKSQEIQPPSEEILSLSESDPRYKLFLANLAQGIGGGRIIIDSSKENSMPSRGDKITFQSILGDQAYPSTIISIEQTTAKDVGSYTSTSSLKERAKSGVKVSIPERVDEREVPGSQDDAPPISPVPKYINGMIPWVNVKTDTAKKKYPLRLRQDVAEAYNKIYKEVKSIGGIMWVAGAGRSLEQKAGVGASRKSMHYLGRAIDLGIYSGMQDPNKDLHIITKDESGRWTVWQRIKNKNYPEIELDAVVFTGKKPNSKLITVKVKARVFNFTEIAKKYGFNRIPGYRWFYTGGPYDGAEWWHFQYQGGLVKGESIYGNEMLLVYPEAEAKKFIYWQESKDLVWSGSGFDASPKKQKYVKVVKK